MYTPKAALQLFNRQHRNLIVSTMSPYKSNYYLFVAKTDPNKTDCNDPYYLMNKETGNITHFVPRVDDIRDVQEAVYCNAIDLKTLK